MISTALNRICHVWTEFHAFGGRNPSLPHYGVSSAPTRGAASDSKEEGSEPVKTCFRQLAPTGVIARRAEHRPGGGREYMYENDTHP